MLKVVVYYFSIFLLIFMPFISFSQSPDNLNNDISWSAGFSSISDIETAYNNARRQEEIQLGLSTNILGSLVLPTDWNSKADNEKILFLVNEERTIRGGVDYGAGPCLGLPLEGIESNLNGLAGSHASWLMDNNEFSHVGENNWDAFTRIDNDAVLGEVEGCHEFMSRAENLAGFWSFDSTIPFIAEQAVYGWIYKNEPDWGHRQGILLQDKDLNSLPFGYDNNHGYSINEGFLGVVIHTTSGGVYDPFNFGSWVDGGALVVLNIIDPVDNMDCAYVMEGVLPVEFGDFTASIEGDYVKLNWTTFLEENNAYFSVQHSNQARNFSEIGKVEAKQTNTEKKEYSFIHQSPLSGHNYYRIEQFDLNGESQFSKIISIPLLEKWTGNIQNNLLLRGDDLNIQFKSIESIDINIAIFDINGNRLHNQEIHLDERQENVSVKFDILSSGLHSVVLNSNDRVETHKVFVVNSSE